MIRSKKIASRISRLQKQIYRNSSNSGTDNIDDNQLKDKFDTVIIGGGVVGTSLAYHLADEGCTDVLLLEKTQLTAGSTWHAAGLVAYYNVGINAKKVHYDSLTLYKRLQRETGQDVGLHTCGSLRLATNAVRVDEMKYQMSRQRWNLADQWMMTPREIQRMHPLLNMDGIEAGLYNPGDGHIDPYSLTQALATGARNKGAKIRLNSEVTAVTQTKQGDWSITLADVATPLRATRVVNASGFWAKELGESSGLRLPLIAVQHQYLVTSKVEQTANLRTELPVIRDLEGSYYLRQERDGLLFGIYEDQHKMKIEERWYEDRVTPGFGRELFDSDVDRLQENIEVAMHRVPALKDTEIRSVVNGPITYSPDGLPLVGPYNGLRNYWCAVGFGYGIIHAGGIGKYLASWMTKGHPPYDLIEFDANRFSHDWVDSDYTKAKVRETYGMMNHVSFPFEERPAGRPSKRTNDLYDHLKVKGAQFGFHSGWEQAHWFNKNKGSEVKDFLPSPNFKRPDWFNSVSSECHLVHNRVGVIDLSSFGKIIVSGPDASSFIDRICANTVPKVDMTNLSHMLTSTGKILSELTVSRLDNDTFYCVTGSASEIHDLRWMTRVADQENFDVRLRNASDDHCVLGLAGPLARRLLSLIAGDAGSDDDYSATAFPFMATRSVQIAGCNVRAVRVSYSGELGYEIYVDRSSVKDVYDALMSAGDHMGIGDFGAFAMNSMRLEKGFRAWGSEINLDTNPIEAGLAMFVKTQKECNFIGKQAVQEVLNCTDDSSKRRLALFNIEMDSQTPLDANGNETIWYNDKVVGNTTSGCFGHISSLSLCYAYVPLHLASPGTVVQVELLGERYNAQYMSEPPMVIQPIREKRKMKSCDQFGKEK